MASRKEFDWVGENLANPTFTNTDFKDVGINISNTSIGPESVYINNPQIRALPEFQTDGKFDLLKFHEKYVQLAKSYNDLAKDTYSRDIRSNGRIFAENDIFVSPEERRQTSGAYMTLINNPDHITYGIVGIDAAGPRTKTPMELAEGHPIFDSKTGKFTEDTPEESLLKYFWRPKMMATYDTDVDINGNPTDDPLKIAHVKGEYKLTEDGEYYTEFVNGRSTYGKEVVSHWNILTKEDSWINKYDPFDSDDIKKSTTGSIVRNALKIIPLFTPVAPYYAAASIGINLVDALGTLGKLVAGSENHTLNNITAFAEQFNLTTSEEGVKHTFSMENILNMVGDTFLFLESLRIIAELAPALFDKETARIMKDPNAEIRELTGNYIATLSKAIDLKYNQLKTMMSDLAELDYNKAEEIRALTGIAATRASAIVGNRISNYQKLGRLISTGMMAVTFGLHTYGTAKAQGVTDEAATALTLGAIAGQYGLLSSHIGLKIFPEAQLERQQIRKAIKEWLSYGRVDNSYYQAFEDAATKLAKEKAVLSLFKKGRDLAQSIWDVLNSLSGTIAASTAATGIEMVSFSVLDDLIASVYNLAAWVSGEKNRMMAWLDIEGRYGSALLGGAIAGGITAKKTYENAMRIRNMARPEAFELIVHMINEGKEGELIKVIDKGDWAPEYLSTEVIAREELGNGQYEELYGTGTPDNNQNAEIKLVLKNAIYDLKTVLETYGTIISKDSLLDVMVNGKNITKDLRFAALKQSNFAQAFLEEYINNLLNIYEAAKEISVNPENKKETERTDAIDRKTDKELSELEKSKTPAEYQEKESLLSKEAAEKLNAKKSLSELLKINRSYFDGTKREEFISKALFEMLPGLNMAYVDMYFTEWAKNEKGVDDFNKLSLAEKKELAKKFYYTLDSKLKLQILNNAYNFFIKTNEKASKALTVLKEASKNERLKDFVQMFERQRIATKNHLFAMFDTKAGVVNPYEEEEKSPFSFSLSGNKNTPIRPELVIAAMNFPGYARNKRGYDSYYLLALLLHRYPEKAEAIKELFTILDSITEYKNFVKKLKERRDLEVLDYPLKLKAWEERKKEFFNDPENIGEFPEQAPEPPQKITKNVILAAIQEKINEQAARLNTPEGEEIPQELLTIRLSEDKFLNLFKGLHLFIEANKENTDQETVAMSAAAEKLYNALLDYAENPNSTVSFESDIRATVQHGIVFNLGKKFIEELTEILGTKGGYLNDFLKEQITDFISDVGEYLDGENTGIRLPLTIDGTSDGVKIFDLLDVIGFLPKSSQAGMEVQSIAESLSDFNTFARLDGTLSEKLDLSNKTMDLLITALDYNSDGVLAAADSLMKALTGNAEDVNNVDEEGKKKVKTVSDILKKIDKEVNLKTAGFAGFGMDRLMKVDEFILSEEFIADINTAILVLQMLRSSYAASTEEVKSAFNHIGYNATMNKIRSQRGKEYTPLVTLGVDLVEEGIKNIENSIYKLMYWKEVAANAMMLRTKITDRADLAFRINLIDLASKKIYALESKGWQGVNEFRETVSGLSVFNRLKDKERVTRLSDATEKDYEAATRELITFETALNKFFLKNIDIINDPIKLAEFINEENFKIENTINPIRNDDTLQDDLALIWYFATISAMSPEVFYSNLKESLLENRLPVVLQTQWKYNAAAFYRYKNIFNKFRQALIESKKRKKDKDGNLLYAGLFSEDPETKRKAEEKFAREELSLTKNVRRTNTMLISSGPGFGKSSYVPELIVAFEHLFKDFNKETDLWISGPDDPEATDRTRMAAKMRENIGAKNTKVFNRDSLMKMVLKDFDDYDSHFNVVNGKLNSDLKLELNFEDGSVKFPFELNDGIDKLPKLILIDEISEFSQFDLDVLDAFAQKNDIIILALGDFSQSGIYGTVEVNEGESTPAVHNLGLKDVEFIRSFKSQLSFRSSNTQTDRNNGIMRTYIDRYLKYLTDPLHNTAPGKLMLRYYVDDRTGDLFGTYILENTGALEQKTKTYIEGMYKSLKEGEKVVLLYGDNQSLVYLFINEHSEWKDKTQFRQGSTVKSTENKYYIIDLNNVQFNLILLNREEIPEIERIVREYYTALTRQEQGTIIIDNISLKIPNMAMENEGMDTNTTKISLPSKFVLDRSLRFALILGELFPEVLEIKTPKKKETKSGETLPTKKEPGESGDFDDTDWGGDTLNLENFAKLSTLTFAVEERKRPLVIGRNKGKVLASGTTNGGTPFELPDEYIEFILNTFNALRTGLTDDFKYSDYAEQRRDCINGLRYIESLLSGSTLEIPNLDNPDQDTAYKAMEYIMRIHNMVRTMSNNDIKKELYDLLHLKAASINGKPIELKNLDIRYGVVTYPESWEPENGKHLQVNPYIYVNREKEHTWGAKGNSFRNNEINRKELVLIIGLNNGKESDDVLMTVPILTFPYYKTVYNKGKADLPKILTDAVDKVIDEVPAGHKQNLEIAKVLRELLLLDPNIKGAAALLKIIEFYCHTSNDIYYLDSETQLVKTPDNKDGLFEHLGWFISSTDRGFDYDFEGFEQTSRENIRNLELQVAQSRLILHDVQSMVDEGDKDVSRIYTVTIDNAKLVKDAKVDGFTLYSGASYVFVADKGAFNDTYGDFVESDMIKYFERQLIDPENTPIKVKAIAVRPPEASFEDFIESEYVNMFLKKEEKERLDIGNDFTVYRILQKLVLANIGTNKVKSVSDCIIALKESKLHNYDNIQKEILKLTYLEGILSPKRKEKLKEIFELADSLLEVPVKIDLNRIAETYKNPNDPNDLSVYVTAISAYLKKLVSEGSRNMQLRTALRRFLLIAYDPDRMSNSEFKLWEHYDKTDFQRFMKEAAKDLAILYNPEFWNPDSNRQAKDPVYTIKMNLTKSTTKEVNLLLVKTDNESDYKYNKKEFQYASTLFSGPFVGNVMKIIDRVNSRGAEGIKFSPKAERINVFEKRAKTYFTFADDFTKSTFEGLRKDVSGTIQEMNDILNPYGLYVIKNGRSNVILSLANLPTGTYKIYGFKYKDFKSKNHLIDTITYKDSDIIVSAHIKNGEETNVRHYRLQKSGDKYMLLDINKKAESDPWAEEFDPKQKVIINNTLAILSTNKSGTTTLFTFTNPTRLGPIDALAKRLLVSGDTVIIETENGDKIPVNTTSLEEVKTIIANMLEIILDNNRITVSKNWLGTISIVPKQQEVTINDKVKRVKRIIITPENEVAVTLDPYFDSLVGEEALKFLKEHYPDAEPWYKDILSKPVMDDKPYKLSPTLKNRLNKATNGTLSDDSLTITQMLDILQLKYPDKSKKILLGTLINKTIVDEMGNEFKDAIERYIRINCV